jgi:hypothetical protein
VVAREQLCQACGSRTATTHGMLCDVCQQMTTLGTSSRDTMMQLRAPQKLTLLTLPLDIMVKILEFGSDRRLCALAQTCLKLRIVAANNENWYNLCLNNCCSRCARCFKWSHSVSPIDTDATGRQVPPLFGFYKNYYKEKFERCINMSDQPQAMRRTMHRRCIFCSGARRDPGVPPPRLPNEPAHGEPLACPTTSAPPARPRRRWACARTTARALPDRHVPRARQRAPDALRPRGRRGGARLDSGRRLGRHHGHDDAAADDWHATDVVCDAAGLWHGFGTAAGPSTMGMPHARQSMQPQPGVRNGGAPQQQPAAATATSSSSRCKRPHAVAAGAGAVQSSARRGSAPRRPTARLDRRRYAGAAAAATLAAPAAGGATAPRVTGAALYGGNNGAQRHLRRSGTAPAAAACAGARCRATRSYATSRQGRRQLLHAARSSTRAPLTAPPPAGGLDYVHSAAAAAAATAAAAAAAAIARAYDPLCGAGSTTQSAAASATADCVATSATSRMQQRAAAAATMVTSLLHADRRRCAKWASRRQTTSALQALTTAHGNVDAAVGILLSQ